ncbi:hypothetical protein CVU37_09090 [candidate division BRC1 bacterium HGW-BRC1-1]|jgi:type II secretory ATPase GspE/PulE/Tfp pilus assembly ATPase PilB-like protein|nr:MAG: hypothetical protein CVU37_09090 [candidate division BRC1 bacterium HGW-BRC1-1]
MQKRNHDISVYPGPSMKPIYLIIALAVCVLTPDLSHADVIHFKTGGQREVVILSETDEIITYRDPSTNSEMRLPRNLIDRIERTGSDSGQEVGRRARSAFDNGQPEEAFKIIIEAAKTSPGDAATLAQIFPSLISRQIASSRARLASEPNAAVAGYELALKTLRDPALKALDKPAGSFDSMIVTANNELAQVWADAATKQPADALPMLRKATELAPANIEYQLRLAAVAKAAGDNATAQSALKAVIASPDARAEQKAMADAQIQGLGVTPSSSQTPQTIASPTPVEVFPMNNTSNVTPPGTMPPPSQTAQTAPGSSNITPEQVQESAKGMVDRVKHFFTTFKWNELPGQMSGWFQSAIQAGVHILVGILAAVWLLLYALPNWFLKMRSKHGDIAAAESRQIAKRYGIFALFPYLLKARKAGPTKNKCPFCNKGIDNIEAYRDLNFYVCPHCQENITPIYDLKDYISHLIQQLDFESRRVKDKGSESVVERDAMQKLVRAVLTLAVRRRASDIHLDTESDGTAKLRSRIDGLMYDMITLPKGVAIAFISALKIMATLDITERRTPQDGKASLWVDKNDLDLRINTSPASQGEKVSIRILNQKSIQVDPSRLGLEGDNLEKFQRSIHRPHGVIIVTGPSGSGKSTTLYVALNEINTGEKNIVTIEDPIEYQLKGISQMQVNPAANFTFATGLRSILRQDPDVIMVGEIRDKETAVIAVESAMTGHLVFTTLHTIDAPTAFGRLADMAVDSRRLAESVICVLGQRLVRTICPICRKAYKPKKADLEMLELADSTIEFVHGSGCDNCLNTGYQGRLGVFEFLMPDDAIREVLETRAQVSVLRELARKTGYRPMRDEGILRINQGVTTVEEVIRVTI